MCFFYEVAVNCVSGCRPSALTSRWYPVSDRCRTSADKSAFGCIIRLLAVFQNIGCVPKVFCEKRAQAPPNQRTLFVKHLNTKDMLTAVDIAAIFSGTLAQFQARESWWEAGGDEKFQCSCISLLSCMFCTGLAGQRSILSLQSVFH